MCRKTEISQMNSFCFNYDGFDDDMEQLVGILNLFAGQISFTELYNMPVDLLSELTKAKIKLREEEEKQLNKSLQNKEPADARQQQAYNRIFNR